MPSSPIPAASADASSAAPAPAAAPTSPMAPAAPPQPTAPMPAQPEASSTAAGPVPPTAPSAAPSSAPSADASDYKAAKAAYKQARKDAGKSRKPLVIGIIIAAVVLLGAGAAGMWALMGGVGPSGQPDGVPASAESEVEATAPEADGGQTSAEGSPAVADQSVSSGQGSSAADTSEDASSSPQTDNATSKYRQWVGTWTGELAGTEVTWGQYRCYGAENVPMTLTIEDITNVGKVTAKVKFLFHNHDSSTLESDVASTEGDVEVDLTDLVGTFDSHGFVLRGTGADYSGITIDIEPVSGSENSLKVVVKTDYFDDTYELRKQ